MAFSPIQWILMRYVGFSVCECCLLFCFSIFADLERLVCMQLPDYHEIIKQPMEFGTLGRKLDGGRYANLEELEVCIC